MASDDYECLREDYILSWGEIVGENRDYFCRIPYTIEGTALSRLIFGLRLSEGEGYSPLDMDITHGVNWNELSNRIGFSKLHKIVYGITSQPLDAEIETRPEDLDRPDSIGLTALWYACWLGNSNHIRILIRHGADVNNARIPPICAAVWSGSYDSVEHLLNAGVCLTDWSTEALYQTLMYFTSRPGADVEEVLAIDKALFGRCFDINHRPSLPGKATPLMTLARQNLPYSHARMKQLLELGADIELSDERAMTALHHAIWAGNTVGCKILRRAGANANVQTNKGRTVLHTAIKSAFHPGIIQAVSELNLSGVELCAKDWSGCTAFELFKTRAGRHRNDQRLFPGLSRFKYFDGFFRRYLDVMDSVVKEHYVKNIDTELQILLSFQTLLQQVQEAQGIPIEDRYPLLNLTRELIMVNQNENMRCESVTTSMPGAWPEE